MKITLDMPVVTSCEIDGCAYNLDNNCHACAITIGDGVHPGCDTYFSNSTHTHNMAHMAGVGACKVTACKYNDDFECSAESIEVGRDKDGFGCLNCELH